MAFMSRRSSVTIFAALLPLLVVAVFAALPAACTTIQAPSTTFFDGNIAPVLSTTCVRSPTGSGCHVADAHGNAFGNLDTSSYAGISKRRDLLATYGPYGQPSLLMKNILPFAVSIQVFDGTIVHVTTDIKHTGGQLLDPTGGAFQALKQWMDNGATEENTGIPVTTLVRYPCNSVDPNLSVLPFSQSGFDPSKIDHAAPDYLTFKSTVAPFIESTCASGNCHGTSSNELYFLCGSDAAQLDWNYFVAGQYITNPPGASELLRRPLAPQAGGSFHEGGTIFATASDPNYQAFLVWAKQHGAATFANVPANLTFFARRVQPMLVKKGCMMLQCHSAAMAHDYRLRGGSGGSFSYAATLKNYQLTLAQMSFESPTVDASRLVRKNLLRPVVADTPLATALEFTDAGESTDGGEGTDGGDVDGGSVDAEVDGHGLVDAAEDVSRALTDASADSSAPADAVAPAGASAGAQPLGIVHRGGPLLEDFGAKGPSGAACDAAKYAYDDPNLDLDTVPAYCMIREWFIREQAARALAPFSAIVYVKRPVPQVSDRAQDWDLFTGPAELHIVKASLDAAGDVTLGADAAVDLTKCGLAARAEVMRPAVSWDGTTIAFAARSTASDSLAIYQMSSAGTGCTKLPLDTPAPPPSPGCAMLPSGTPVHDFDPAYAPDGRIAFASTRGNLALAQGNVDYCGPQNTPADPTKLNSNMYVYDPSSGSVTQLTFLLNMERHPNFMDDGRLIMTTEKRAPGFYQLALRRQNLDTGDYHPLYGQRGSIGYDQVDQVVHLSDKNFAAIFSQKGALHQGGLLGIFNRSVGVDFLSNDPKDYPVDPSVIDPSSPTSVEPAFFLHSLSIPDTASTGTPGNVGNIYTTPAQLPGAKVLVSMSSTPSDPATFDGAYDLVVLDPETGTSTMLIPGNGAQIIEAVGVYAKAVRGPNLPPVFQSSLDEPNGHTMVTPNSPTVDMTLLSVPLLTSLIFQNTPTGRVTDPGLTSVDIYEDLPPTPDVTSLSGSGPNITTDAYGPLYVRRRLLGTLDALTDGSAHVELPGGVPLVLHLPNTPTSMRSGDPRWQREEMEFSPGETVSQLFPPTFFSNVCGQCHGSVSGQQLDVSVQPDVLTQASIVAARGAPSVTLGVAQSSRGQPMGAPTSP
jgi:hypothetical protein